MANTLRFKRGLLAGLPSAAVGEPLFTTDTFDLYIGTASGTQKYQKFIASGTTSQLLRGDGSLLTMPIVLSSPANGEVLKYNGTNWVNSSDAGVTGSGTAGQVTFWNSASTITGSNNLFWNAANNRLGINTNAPSYTADIRSAAGTVLSLSGGSSTNQGAALYITNSAFTGTLTAFGDSAAILGGTPDASATIFTGSSIPLHFYINGGQAARISTLRNFIINNASTDNGLRFQVTGDGYFSGSVGIGQTSLTGYNLRISKNISGATVSYGVVVDGEIQSSVSIGTINFWSRPTVAPSTTSTNLFHFRAEQGTFNSSTITNQHGFFVDSSLIGATNNYGFYGNIASGTGRWNLYMNGSAANYLNGNLGLGITAPTSKLHLYTTSWDTNPLASIVNLDPNTIDAKGLYVQAGADNKDTYIANFVNYTGNSVMYLNGVGNLGLGVTPSAWDSTYRALQVGVGTSLYNLSTSNGTFLGSNYFFNGTNNIYINTATATAYGQVSGQHQWFNAPSGTAGNAISFTQAMTLDASGNLLVGQNSNPYTQANRTVIGLNGTTDSLISMSIGGSAAAYLYASSTSLDINANSRPITFSTTGTEKARILNNGRFLINTTTDLGFLLDVNGTMRVSGASTFASSVSISGLTYIDGAATALRTNNTVSYTSLESRLNGTRSWQIDNVSNAFQLYMQGAAAYVFNIASTGAATFSSSVTAGTDISARNGDISIGVDSQFSAPYMALGFGGRTNAFNRIYAARDTTAGIVFSATTGAGFEFRTNGHATRAIVVESDGTFNLQRSASGANTTLQFRNEVSVKRAKIVFGGTNEELGFYAGSGATEHLSIASTGAATFSSNVGIGGTPAQRLDVQGSANSVQARFGNVAGRGLTIGTSAISGTNDAGVVFDAPTATDGTLIFQTTSVERARISGSGNLLINTTSDTGYKLRVNGTSYFDDNLRFPNLKGCVFVQTGGSLLGSIAMDSGNAVTIDNNGFAGLSVGGSYTMTGGNLGIGHSAFGTSATKTISVNSGTAPSTSPADAFQLYSADITAGNAAPHFRTENGAVIKLYQETTGVTSATYIGGAGTTVTDLDTFDGYTIPQIVKALRNAGLLA